MAGSVVVTGVGMVTPLGDSPDEVLRRIESGESAARRPTRFDAGMFSCPVCAEIGDFDAARFVPEPKALRLMNRDAALAVAAARLAMGDAGIRAGDAVAREDVGLFGATGLAGIPLGEVAPLIRHSTDPEGRFDARRFGEAALKRVRPVLSFKILSNMPICFVSIFEGIQGVNAVYNPWEGQGAQAITAGVRAVRGGRATCALVGGCDVKAHELAFISLEQQGVFRSWRETGAGCVPAEGAVFLLLEDERHARGRGAAIYARIVHGRMATAEQDGDRAGTWRDLMSPLVTPATAAVVSAAEAGTAARAAEDRVLAGAGLAASRAVRPKPSVGNLFAAAAALQVALASLIARRLAPGERVLADCFGHGSEQAAFALEAA